MQKFEEHIKRIIAIPDTDLEKILSCFRVMTVNKNERLINTGQTCDCYYFVEKGSLRIYTEVNGMEITSWYAFEGYFFTELESYTYQCATKYNIEAIENTTLLYIPRKNMNELLQTYPAWNELLRKTWELAFLKLSQVVLSFHTLSASGFNRQLAPH
jgi:CRP-like cAMP-binding protein